MYLNLFKIRILIVLLFFSLKGISQDLYPKEKKGKWGYVNFSDKWIIQPKFNAVNQFSEGLAAVKKGAKWGFINSTGKFTIKPTYGYVNDFSEGIAAVLSYKPQKEISKKSNKNYKWGFIDQNGEMIIPFRYRNVFPFKNEIALVANWEQPAKELYMINSNGDSISPGFVDKENYNDNLFKIKNTRTDGDSIYKYITKTGENITDWYLNNFEFKDFPVKVNLPSDFKYDTLTTNAFSGNSIRNLCAMMNKDGKITTPWFNKIGDFSLGHAPAQFNQLWGIINEEYKWTTKPVYIGIKPLEEGFYQGDTDLYSCILLNEKGISLGEEVNKIELFDSNFYMMSYIQRQSEKTVVYKALFDKKGIQRTGWHQQINPFHNGFTRIEEEKQTRFLNDSIGLHNWYNYAIDSTGEVLCFWRAANKIAWGKDNRNLKDSILNFLYAPEVNFHLSLDYFKTVYFKDFVIDFKKSEISFSGGNFKEGMALVSKKVGVIKKTIHGLDFEMDDVRYGYINWYGDLVIPYKFKEASSFSGGKAIIVENNKYGAIDFKGRVIIKPQHQLMGGFGNNLAPVFKDSVWGYVNSKNRLVIKYQYDEVRPFKHGYASVKKGREWGVIDVNGNIILEFDYRKAPKPLSKGKIEVLQKGVGYIVIDV